MRLAIITARGGSKRIPGKNIRAFNGEPIMAYSIRTALAAGCFDEVMVSTDDPGIAEVGCACGAVVPFIRSAKTSGEFSTTAAVVAEVLEEYTLRGRRFDVACCIYPTAPFMTADALVRGLHMLEADPDLTGVIPVARFSYPIQRALRIANGRVSLFQPEQLTARSQDLEPSYHDAGQFYWLRVPEFLAVPSLIGQNTGALVLADWQVQDIDTEDDWRLAELKYRLLQERGQILAGGSSQPQ